MFTERKKDVMLELMIYLFSGEGGWRLGLRCLTPLSRYLSYIEAITALLMEDTRVSGENH